jgi:hypothetical protein
MTGPGQEKAEGAIRSRLTWGKVFAFAALRTLLIFLVLNWAVCWFFRYGAHSLAAFLYPFAWLVLFFSVRARWRISLLLVTIPALILFANGRWGTVESNAGAEAAAFKALKDMHSAVISFRTQHQQGYPETFPPIEPSSHSSKFYVFSYVPRRSDKGEVVGYQIEATPARRDCDFHRSFTIVEDGRIYWTLEPRAATTSDNLYSWDIP